MGDLQPSSPEAAGPAADSSSSSFLACITPWWKDAVIYQIYPASFKDSNDDGLGDIPGIISKLDYIKSLGVDAIWLSPMYESPQKDMGYDVSNYEAVHAPYGTLQDAENLIQSCHDRSIRIIFDLVINHTSDQHAWFKESRASKDNNPRRDWYIWRPARYDANGTRMPPNNWRSWFGGSSWEWDEATQEYYFHLFAKEQPDLNWENPKTRNAIYESAIEFWLKKGVDGFRLDGMNMYSKGIEFLDAQIVDPTTFEQPAEELSCDGPRMHEYLREMNAKVFSKYNAMTVGEAQAITDPKRVLHYIGADNKQLDMVHFDLLKFGHGKTYKFDGNSSWDLSDVKTMVNTLQTFIDGTDGWTTTFLENHDNPRSVSRFTSDAPEWRERSAKLLAILNVALTGTLFLYQGQEIGAINVHKSWPIEEYQDLETRNFYDEVSVRDPASLPKIMKSIQDIGRDNARLPMCWDDSAFAGFTGRREGAWMRVHDDYRSINVAKNEANPDSVLHFWRAMLKRRKQLNDLFVHSTFELWDLENKKTFMFRKKNEISQAVVVLNFTAEKQPWKKPDAWTQDGKWVLIISNVQDTEEATLAAYEGRIYLISLGFWGV